jgi:hypothetical protein
MKTTILSMSSCPRCGYGVDAATAAYGNVQPKPGDVSICLNCAALMQFNDDLKLGPGPESLLDELPADKRRLIERGRRYIRERGRFDEARRRHH